MVSAVTVEGHLIACAIKRDTLASCNRNGDARLDGQISRNGEVVTAWVDSDWAVSSIPSGVLGDVGGDVSTLAFERHGSVVHSTIIVGVLVAVVCTVVRPVWSNCSCSSKAARGVRQLWHVTIPCGHASNQCSGSRTHKVHVSVSSEVDTVIAVCVVVVSTKVGKVESIRHWDVVSTLVSPCVPVVAGCTVVARWCTRRGTHDVRCISVHQSRESTVKRLVAATGRRGRDSVVCWVRVCTGDVLCAGSVSDGLTHCTGLIHESNSCSIVRIGTSVVVLELDFIGHVVEDGLVRTDVSCSVAHVSPFDDEHLVRVTNTEGFCRGRLRVNSRSDGRNVLSLHVVFHSVSAF